MKSALKTGVVIAAIALGGCDRIRELTGMPDESAANTSNTSAVANTSTALGDSRPRPPRPPIPRSPARSRPPRPSSTSARR